jgi:hypothetical protein
MLTIDNHPVCSETLRAIWNNRVKIYTVIPIYTPFEVAKHFCQVANYASPIGSTRKIQSFPVVLFRSHDRPEQACRPSD